MTFEEWWKSVDDWDWVNNEPYEVTFRQAFEAGWREGHKEGYTYRETVYKAQEGGV